MNIMKVSLNFTVQPFRSLFTGVTQSCTGDCMSHAVAPVTFAIHVITCMHTVDANKLIKEITRQINKISK